MLRSFSHYCHILNSGLCHATTGLITRIIYSNEKTIINSDCINRITEQYPKIIAQYYKFDDAFLQSLQQDFTPASYFSNEINKKYLTSINSSVNTDYFLSNDINQFQDKLKNNDKYALLFFDNFDNVYKHTYKQSRDIVMFSANVPNYPSCRIGIILVCQKGLGGLLDITARKSKIIRESHPLVNSVVSLNMQKYSQL